MGSADDRSELPAGGAELDEHAVRQTAAHVASAIANSRNDVEYFPATVDLTGQFIGQRDKTVNLRAFSAGKPYPSGAKVLPAN